MDITSRLLWVALRIVQYKIMDEPDMDPIPLGIDYEDQELWNEFLEVINELGGL